MRNQKLTALVLAGALAVGLCGAAVFADEPAQEETHASSQVIGGEGSQREEQPTQAASEETAAAQSEEEGADSSPGVLGNVSFVNLDSQVRKNNCNVLALGETIKSLKAIDYKAWRKGTYQQLVALGNEISSLENVEIPLTGNDAQDPINQQLLAMMKSSSMKTLQQAYASLDATYKDLRNGKMQDDNEATIRQLQNAQDQIVMATESLYVALVQMQINCSALDRSSAALDRTIQEMELRYSMGQISALTLQEVKVGRTSLESGKATMEMNVRKLRSQLEMMLGGELTGEIQIQPLNRVSSQQLDEMDLEKDLEKAKRVSYDIYSADHAWENAKADYSQAKKNFAKGDYQLDMARHSENAAEYTYDATVQNFENGFRTLYYQVKDYQQILSAAETALAVEEASCAAAQLKYEQGTLAYNKLLDARDELADARDKVDTAAIDLFSAYNNYRWAVNSGILN